MLPRVLKYLNMFVDGTSYVGEVQEVSLPKLARKMEKFRSGGMLGEVSIDLGQEPLEIESTFGGYMKPILQQYGIANISGVLMRFAGSYQREDDAPEDSVEIVVRGRHSEIDRGSAKAGDKSEFKVKSDLTYYKEIINGTTIIEIDMINMVFVVDGKDLMAGHRAAIGL